MPPSFASSSYIRPVTRHFPSSKALWDDTNLPLAVVCRPATPAPTPTASKTPTPTTIKPATKPLTAVPKCLHCGAPHPSKASRFRPLNHSFLICYLCGKSSSTRLEDQQEARVEESLDFQVYDRVIEEDTSTEYLLPLFPNGSKTHTNTNQDHVDQHPSDNMTWKLPAMSCPVVWWIVLDASCTSGAYWNSVGGVLTKALQDIPPHVHVGMVAASSTTLSSWDLTTPIPHVLHSSTASSSTVDSLGLVPCDATHLSNIQTALRAVTDYRGGDAGSGVTTKAGSSTGMSLGNTLETILEFLEQATHPGSLVQGNTTNSKDGTPSPLKYAGGKILCLLGGPPVEIESLQQHSPQNYYNGGIGGSCAPTVGKWQDCDKHSPPEVEPTDMTSTNLWEYMLPLHVEDPAKTVGDDSVLELGDDYYQLLGAKCAQAGLGVDVVVLSPQDETSNTTWFGLPFLRGLADRSGAPGPIIVSASHEKVDILQEQVMVRTPWQPGTVFGAALRLRVSPGFQVDATPVEPTSDSTKDNDNRIKPLQLAPFATSGGIMGPATAVPGEAQLWMFGSCDPYTSVTVDLEVIDKEIKKTYHVEAFGEVVLKQAIQTCFAYTCLEYDDEGRAYIVRKERVSTLSVRMANTTEGLCDSLDPEALAVVLFHKLSLSCLQDGLLETQEIGKNWLKSLLVCLYLSIELEQARRTNRLIDERALDSGVTIPGFSPSFVSSDRLLDQQGGELTTEAILLGQGHAQAQILPFLVFALLQCDALRPTNGAFRPSMDARCAAMTQMSSMTPAVLAKCIAPCLQLWSTQEDTPIMEMVDLKHEVILYALQDCSEGDVFFLDCPQSIRLWNAHRMKDSLEGGATDRDVTKITVGPNLQAAMNSAAAAYRAAPIVQDHLNESSKGYKEAYCALDDFLIEDKPTATSVANYTAWKAEIAKMVHTELDSGD